jgi:hypothetical protein
MTAVMAAKLKRKEELGGMVEGLVQEFDHY